MRHPHLKRMKYVTAVFAAMLILAGFAWACGPGDNIAYSGGRGFKAGFAGSGSGIAPGLYAAQAQMNAVRQKFAAQAAIRRAAMRPMRLAKARQQRQTVLATRAARKDVRIAQAQARQAQEEFFAQSRRWTDATGQHHVQAVLVAADSQAVRLKIPSGEIVRVPLDKLSLADRLAVTRQLGNASALLAGL